MKNLALFLIFLFSAIFLSSCQSPSVKGIPSGATKTKANVFYLFHIKNEKNPQAKVGDFLSYHLMVSNNKKDTLFSTYKQKRPLENVPLKEPLKKGTLEEIILGVHAGDSLSVWMSVDTLIANKNITDPTFISKLEKGSYILYTYKILKVQNQADIEKEKSEASLKQKETDKKLLDEYIEKNKLDNVQELASGLRYIKTKDGSGKKAKANDTVSVHYTGKLLNGDVFDSSVNRGQPFEFALQKGMVIKAWDEGIALMKEGEKGMLLIPSELGYGPVGAGNQIPPNTVLIFEVELVKVK